EDGQGTIDEAYLEYRPADARWRLRLGRFQAAWGLDDAMKKSLDQNDSSNFDITWTDGAWLQWRPGDAWTAHLVLRHNDRRGPTTTAGARPAAGVPHSPSITADRAWACWRSPNPPPPSARWSSAWSPSPGCLRRCIRTAWAIRASRTTSR